MPINYISKSADISNCGRFRYMLTRTWDESLPACAFIGLNPSTADANEDDPTIRRCVNFAATWGCGSLYMVNIHPFRATNPKDLLSQRFGLSDTANMIEFNLEAWLDVLSACNIVIAAWGSHGAKLPDQISMAKTIFGKKLCCLSLTKDGHPGHPLYLKADLKPVPLWLVDSNAQ